MTLNTTTTAPSLPTTARGTVPGILGRVLARLVEADRRYREACRMRVLTREQRRDMGMEDANADFYSARGRGPQDAPSLPIRSLW